MTEVTNNQYTLAQFNDFVFEGSEYQLPVEVTNIIKTLVGLLPDSSSPESTDDFQYQKKDRYARQPPPRSGSHKSAYIPKNTVINKNGQSHSHSNGRPIDTSTDWATLRSYKTTKVEAKEGIEKTFSEIRSTLNKLSNKNYNQPRDKILELLHEIADQSEDESSSDEDQDTHASNHKQKIAQAVFDIASTNKFYSEIYATLYNDLVGAHGVFRDMLVGFIQKYIDAFNQITYVDADDNYDQFCDYTKKYDQQKATSAFVVNLLNMGVLSADEVFAVVHKLYVFYLDFMKTGGRENEVEEIAECMSTLVVSGRKALEKADAWQTNVVPMCTALASMKMGDYSSLTSRAIFKFKDILENVSKLCDNGTRTKTT